MKRTLTTLALLLMTVTVVTAAERAEISTIDAAPAPAEVTPQTADPLVPRLSLQTAREMMAEIRLLIDAHSQYEAQLVSNLAEASAEERQSIAQLTTAASEQLYVDMLHVQLRYATDAGLEAEVQRIENNIAMLTEAKERPTHVDPNAMAKSSRQPSHKSTPQATPADTAEDKGFIKGGQR